MPTMRDITGKTALMVGWRQGTPMAPPNLLFDDDARGWQAVTSIRFAERAGLLIGTAGEDDAQHKCVLGYEDSCKAAISVANASHTLHKHAAQLYQALMDHIIERHIIDVDGVPYELAAQAALEPEGTTPISPTFLLSMRTESIADHVHKQMLLTSQDDNIIVNSAYLGYAGSDVVLYTNRGDIRIERPSLAGYIRDAWEPFVQTIVDAKTLMKHIKRFDALSSR